MAWDSSPNGGFNAGHEPWQSSDGRHAEINAEKDLASERSVYRFYQKVLSFRKQSPAVMRGTVREYDHENRRVIAYSRQLDGEKVFVAANFSRRPVKYAIPEDMRDLSLLCGNCPDLERDGDVLKLRPYQAVVFGNVSQ